MANWTKPPIREIINEFHTNAQDGLTESQASAQLTAFGPNEFEEKKKESIWSKIWRQMRDVTTLILLIAAGVSMFLAFTEASGDFAEPIVIIAIIIINIVIGIRQESSAERALEALKSMNTQTCIVIRGGVKQPIDARGLVPGDIIVLEAGDMISADARIIESSGLKTDESVLTGESTPVEKDENAQVKDNAQIGDRTNMVFSGCLVTNGRATAVVVATGMQTEMGKIAALLNDTKQQRTPLQLRLNKLGKNMSLIAIAAGIFVFLTGILLHGDSIMEMLLTGVSLAVAAVPETLPVIVTMTLAFGVQQMVKKHAIIRRIPAVETLGSASVICSDKTGTLTQNQMTVKKLWMADGVPVDAQDEFSDEEMKLLRLFSLANNAVIEQTEDGEKIIGDPTESSIIRLLQDKGITTDDLEEKYPRVYELPFDSERKLMTTVNKMPDGRYVVITKGAFDTIPVDSFTDCDSAQAVHDEFARKALRVMAAAYKYYDKLPEDMSAAELECNLKFAGLIGMIDPPREESKIAVEEAKKAGIRTVMITGDHVVTASAIAREIGILGENDKAITGEDLDEMSQEYLIAHVQEYSVYARVSPEDKIRIVKAWQANGKVVAMTGDGVNDAPALKAADVGVAMGITGTDVAKNAADMVITDDNFATIVDAVSEGRRVYDNIKKTIYFLLSCNISEILIMIVAVALGWGAPVVAIQLLLINIVADGIPGFSLSREKADDDIMLRPPVSKKASIFANGLGLKIAVMSVIFTITALIGFYIGRFVPIGGMAPSYEAGQTMAFVILGYSSVVHIFNVRSTKSIFKIGFLSNKPLFISASLSFAIVTLFALIPPLATVFYLIPLSPLHWLIMILLSLVPLFGIEIYKAFKRFH
ncbi:MAG: cation-translocating P-type ATPase [Christensenella hongkongensis]|uniref:cation-translocating P-type ATPase n=1 Tax=Christensenella hongkongensis TaxID=270498 RepID=UPI002A748A7E|nr:cation-translocating P-type ATPase [Christensenella hongkongensis]MDY3004186.1 cation-translocating P-type ATPase [Christensenella hongkongensis]